MYSMICIFFHQVCSILYDSLNKSFLKMPNTKEEYLLSAKVKYLTRKKFLVKWCIYITLEPAFILIFYFTSNFTRFRSLYQEILLYMCFFQGFYKKWNFPHTLAAIDGKHVFISAPSHSGSKFFSHKQRYELIKK